jgi:hypothetical protein
LHGQAVTLDVLANDVDADGNPLTASVASGPAHGTVTVAADGRLVYTPDAGFVGTDSFSYVASDGQLASAPVTVTLTVTAAPAAQPPVAIDDSLTLAEDGSLRFDVRANDQAAPGRSLTVEVLSAPAHGRLVAQADGSFSYTPDADFFGTDSFSYRVNDGSANSGVAQVAITVTPVNDAPVLQPVADLSVDEGDQVTVDLQASDIDATGPLAYALIDAPAGASIDAQGRISWRAPDGATDAVFTAQVRDAQGATAQQRFVVHVKNVAPTVSFSGAPSVQAGQVYTLGFTLADRGLDTVSGLAIDWGDGQIQQLSPTATSASHVYQAPQTGVRIRLLVTDEDGSYAFATLPLTVTPVPAAPAPQPVTGSAGNAAQTRPPIRGIDVSRLGIAVGNGTASEFGVTSLGQSAHWNVQPLAHAVQDSLSSAMQSLPQPLTPEAIAALIEKFPTSAGERPALYVSSLFATAGGIHVRFNKALDLRALAHGAPLAAGLVSRDIVVLLNGRELAGQLLLDPDGAGFLFVPDGGLLPDGEFEIVLRTDAGGFVSVDGEVLDGNVDGQPGSPFKARMTVKRPAALAEAQMPAVAEPAGIALAASGGIGGAAVLAVGRWRRRSDEDEDAAIRLRLEPGRVGTPDDAETPDAGWLAGWLDRPAPPVNRWRIKP